MRRMMLVLGLLVALGGMAWADNTTTTLVPQASLDQIYEKLDQLAKQQRGENDISRQVAQILKNKEAIMADLQIIKIRSLHR